MATSLIQKKVAASVSGYATRVANMVDLRLFYKAHPDPHLAAGETSLAGEGEVLADERGPQDGGASPKDAGVSPQDPETASPKAAVP